MKKLIVIKHSKFEWEQKILDLSEKQLLDKLTAERANVDVIIQSHEHQIETRKCFKDVFVDSDIKMMDEINEDIKNYDLVIVLGGDNSFTKISHYVGKIPILGVNSDPGRSIGCLTSWSISDTHDVVELHKQIKNHEYSTQKWTRLSAVLNGKQLPLATSEIYLGEKQRANMSRHVMEYKNVSLEQKCSGLIVATGTGSTGWFQSAGDVEPWNSENRMAQFVITEPYGGSYHVERHGKIKECDRLIVHSLNDSEGIISIDSWEEFPFIRGSTVIITLSDALNVIMPNTLANIGVVS